MKPAHTTNTKTITMNTNTPNTYESEHAAIAAPRAELEKRTALVTASEQSLDVAQRTLAGAEAAYAIDASDTNLDALTMAKQACTLAATRLSVARDFVLASHAAIADAERGLLAARHADAVRAASYEGLMLSLASDIEELARLELHQLQIAERIRVRADEREAKLHEANALASELGIAATPRGWKVPIGEAIQRVNAIVGCCVPALTAMRPTAEHWRPLVSPTLPSAMTTQTDRSASARLLLELANSN